MRHLMSYASFDVICAYDINIWRQSIWPILVSKEASGPQESHLWVRFWIKNCFKIKKLKNVIGIFFLYKFWESFVFLGPKRWSWRQHFPEAFRLEIYVFGNLRVHRMGSGGLLFQIWTSVHYAPPLTVIIWHVCTFWKSSAMLTAVRSSYDMFF